MSRIVVACVRASSIAVVGACRGGADALLAHVQRAVGSSERFFSAWPLRQ